MNISKEETAVFVKQVYATYNQPLLLVDEKSIFRAWYDLLSDLPHNEIRSAFQRLATHEKYMPRPGDVRRATIDYLTKLPPHIDAYSAWGIFQGMVRDMNSGVANETNRPEALIKTLQSLGDGAMGMHTNGDREVFVRVYEKVVVELDKARYEFKPQ